MICLIKEFAHYIRTGLSAVRWDSDRSDKQWCVIKSELEQVSRSHTDKEFQLYVNIDKIDYVIGQGRRKTANFMYVLTEIATYIATFSRISTKTASQELS